jgi:tyrosine decarboxylase / aspartate 1-decarboxylase
MLAVIVSLKNDPMNWKKLTAEQINTRINKAISENIDYRKDPVLGIPGTYLDPEEFYEDAPFLEQAPFLKTLISNPNNIGCHTLIGPSGPFPGTQKIEIELIKLCAEEIFKGEEDQQDGYVTSGGTEANIYAIWVYRNMFMKEYNAKAEEIAIVYSSDSHYSMPKAGNLLQLKSIVLPVDNVSRQIDIEQAIDLLREAKSNGKKYFIVVSNLSTTMFGSIDDINKLTKIFKEEELVFKLHIDAAFGGFIFPFINEDDSYSFRNSDISSVTIDAHKMLQAPYGTGIILMRKGLVPYVMTEEAQYIPGKDQTLCGSRSGANAVAVWMILMAHGAEGWKFKMRSLIDRTDEICTNLDRIGVKYFRNPDLNIIAIRSEYVEQQLAERYQLVPDTFHSDASWYKIVVMPHIRKGVMDRFLTELAITAKKVS